jgi:hypothetical protein
MKTRETIIEELRQLQLTRSKRFVTHIFVHLDEGWSILILRQELAKRFPDLDLNDVPVVFISNNNEPFEGKDGWEHLSEGTYILGCGGQGPFNHHPHEDYPDLCTADQVAIALGLDQKPEYALVLRRLRVSDLHGGGDFKAIADQFKLSNIDSTEKLDQVLLWFQQYLDLFVASQQVFHSEEMNGELNGKSRVWSFNREGEEIKVVTVSRSDKENIHSLAHIVFGPEIVIVQRISGNVQIFTYPSIGAKRKRVTLRMVGAILRLLNQRAAGFSQREEDLRVLIENGFSHGWLYSTKAGWLLNGSKTSQVDPTPVPLERIEEAVILGVKYHPDFPWRQWVAVTHNRPMSESVLFYKAKIRN